MRGACIALTMFLAFSAELSAGEAKSRPNIVFILVDDMGWTDAHCLGSAFYHTPNIDRLAKLGTRFTSGYAAGPVCSPTRASILSGKYPARTKNTDWFGGGARKGRLLPAPYDNFLPLDEVTLAELLRRAGYRTAHIGKWHLGGKGHEPERYGFDVAIAGTERGSPASYFSPYKNPRLKDGPAGEELTDRLTSEGLKFIEDNKDRPFFLYLNHFTVHTPLQAKKDLIEKYKAKAAKLGEREPFAMDGTTKVRQIHDHAVYAAMVETLDISVGRILDKLRELGLDENTIVIFTSDNGGLATSEGWPTSNLPLRMGKGWLYEGGVRVPWIVACPGRWPGGRTTDHPVCSIDFLPTLLEATGGGRAKKQVDGASFAPLLEGKARMPERNLYWHYPHYSNQFGTPSGSVRSGDLVLIEFFEDGRLELYDLKKDIGQKKDLAKGMAERTREMHRLLVDWRREVGAVMPKENPDWKR